MYWIDVLLLAGAVPLLGWLAYGFSDSIQHNDARGLFVWCGVAGFVVAVLAVLYIAGVISV
jgi:hypothetical protein